MPRSHRNPKRTLDAEAALFSSSAESSSDQEGPGHRRPSRGAHRSRAGSSSDQSMEMESFGHHKQKTEGEPKPKRNWFAFVLCGIAMAGVIGGIIWLVVGMIKL
ncbi:hypothetical protein JCM10207_007151 [Rhodosporidiobolus poonsookiae]